MSNEDKKETYKNFNRAVKILIRELIATYPEISELKLAFIFYKMAKTLSYKRPNRLFNTMIAQPHSQHIIDNNFDAILNDNYDLDVETGYIDTLKKYFREVVDDANKNIIRDHLLVLLALNQKCLVFETSNK